MDEHIPLVAGAMTTTMTASWKEEGDGFFGSSSKHYTQRGRHLTLEVVGCRLREWTGREKRRGCPTPGDTFRRPFVLLLPRFLS
jgi:hypothetical protein